MDPNPIHSLTLDLAPSEACERLAPASRAASGAAWGRYLEIRRFEAWHNVRYGQRATLNRLTADVLARYRADALSRMSPGAFNRRRAALSWLCKRLYRLGVLANDPMRSIPCAKRRVRPAQFE